MPHPRFEKLDEARKRKLIDAAGHEFARSGYKNASLNAIIEACGLSKGSFYYYFDGKADLFMTLIDFVKQIIFQGEKPDFSVLTAEQFWPMIEIMGDRSVALAGEYAWAAKLSRVIQQEPEVIGEPMRLFLVEMQGVLRDMLLHGQKLGQVRSDIPLDLMMSLAQSMDQATDRWMAANWEKYPTQELAQYTKILMEMTRNFLSPPQKDLINTTDTADTKERE
jgi:AcrR family transcriptional regulator